MASAAVAPPLTTDFSLIKSKFNKKSSFEEAVKECIDAITASPESVTSENFKAALRRALTIARSRFNDNEIALWRAGLHLVRAAASASAGREDPAFSDELAEYENVCLNVLGQDGERETDDSNTRLSTRPPPPSLFEGQLSELNTPSTTAQTAASPHSAIQDLAAMLLGRDLGADTAEGGTTEEQTPEMAEALQRELDAIAVEIMEATANDAPRAPPPPTA